MLSSFGKPTTDVSINILHVLRDATSSNVVKIPTISIPFITILRFFGLLISPNIAGAIIIFWVLSFSITSVAQTTKMRFNPPNKGYQILKQTSTWKITFYIMGDSLLTVIGTQVIFTSFVLSMLGLNPKE